MNQKVVANPKSVYKLYSARRDNICEYCNSVLKEHFDYVPYGDTLVKKRTFYCPNCG